MRKTAIVTPRKAAEMLGVSLHFVYQLLWENRLSGSEKVGKKWRIPVTAVESRLRQTGQRGA